MDIRAANSIKKITDAFIEMRKRKSLESISVTALCKAAGVNKSTFYAHFQDIYDLTDKLETKIIQDIISLVDLPDDVAVNGQVATEAVFNAYLANAEIVNIVFTGSRAALLPQKTEAVLKETIYSIHPEYREDLEINVMLSMMIYGGFYAFKTNDAYDAKKVVEIIGRYNTKIR